MSRPTSDPGRGAATETPSPIHVLRVADVRGDQLGGAARAMRETSALLIQRGHVVDHRFSEDMPIPGPERWRRILVPIFVLSYVTWLKVRGEGPDLVEIHEPLAAPYAIVRALTMRRQLPPMVAFSHGLEERAWRVQRARWQLRGQKGPLSSRFLVPLTLVAPAKIALRLADTVIVLSSQDRDHLLHKRGRRSGRIYRIDNGVEEDLLTLPRAPRGPDGSVVLLFVGSWIDRKGTPELVQAFTRLCRDHPNARLIVAGAGRRPDEVLSSFAASVQENLEVHQSVTRSELRELLGRADLYVLPSWFEGMPLSLLEAAAAGLPIVASDTCGIRDVLRPNNPAGDGGRLVPPHDGAALHAALDELFRDPALRVQLGARARARARAFPWSSSADALERAYLASV